MNSKARVKVIDIREEVDVCINCRFLQKRDIYSREGWYCEESGLDLDDYIDREYGKNYRERHPDCPLPDKKQ